MQRNKFGEPVGRVWSFINDLMQGGSAVYLTDAEGSTGSDISESEWKSVERKMRKADRDKR